MKNLISLRFILRKLKQKSAHYGLDPHSIFYDNIQPFNESGIYRIKQILETII